MSGIITSGGKATNIIPAYAAAEYFLRCDSRVRLAALEHKFRACFEAGSVATGARLEISSLGGYEDHVPNRVLAHLYRKHFNALGGNIPHEDIEAITGKTGGATDQGNVSHVVPSLHAVFAIPSEAGPHNPNFASAAATDRAHVAALTAAKAVSLAALDVLIQRKTFEDLKRDSKADGMERSHQ